ncbi:hypothetical protein BS47DRAFT_348525 [Hydnum rufescens UP504]|uniref:Uncharacterized protein n=1 Tax=Hydnum rufescens UP504 TaxID=1448309 RepID=A0A9P6AJY9_9AGAM|nr:hypothetical protein BS47DRAFT_348525 [Hydnum rufescens UP504]
MTLQLRPCLHAHMHYASCITITSLYSVIVSQLPKRAILSFPTLVNVASPLVIIRLEILEIFFLFVTTVRGVYDMACRGQVQAGSRGRARAGKARQPWWMMTLYPVVCTEARDLSA